MQLNEQTDPRLYPPEAPAPYADSVATDGVAEPSIGTLFTDLTDDMGKLVRQEIELARVETMDKVSKAMRSVIFMVVGGLVVYAGFIVVLIAAAILLGQLMPYWASALVVGAIVLIVGAILLNSGRNALNTMTVVPEKTVQSIKEDAHWAKEQVS